MCSDGPANSTDEAYYFTVTRGPRADSPLLIYFQGGGACWSAETCAITEVYQATAAAAKEKTSTKGFFGEPGNEGEVNAFDKYTIVFVPYCTGDLHVGSEVVDYGNGLVVHHAGAANARSVLEWTYANFPESDQLPHVAVSGCSAGALGSHIWVDAIAEHYGSTPVVYLGDGYVATDNPNRDFHHGWGELPHEVHEDVRDAWFVEPNQAMPLVLKHNPTVRFGYTLSQGDQTQRTFFFFQTGLSPSADFYSLLMFDTLETLSCANANMAVFLANDTNHCHLPRNNVWSELDGGQSIADWAESFLNDDEATPSSVCGVQVDNDICDASFYAACRHGVFRSRTSASSAPSSADSAPVTINKQSWAVPVVAMLASLLAVALGLLIFLVLFRKPAAPAVAHAPLTERELTAIN